MKISSLQEFLSELQHEYGDIEVGIWSEDEEIATIQVSEVWPVEGGEEMVVLSTGEDEEPDDDGGEDLPLPQHSNNVIQFRRAV